MASMSSSCMCCAHCSGDKSVRSSVVPYFNCPARLRSKNEATTDATTVSSGGPPSIPSIPSMQCDIMACSKHTALSHSIFEMFNNIRRTLGARFEEFVHEEVQPVVDVELQVMQLVGGVRGYTRMGLQNRVYGCPRPHDEQLQRRKPDNGVQGVDGAHVYDDRVKGVGV